MEITKMLSPNFGYPRGTKGRNGQKIIAIVQHVSGGYWDSNKSWIMQEGSGASYHYYIKKDGEIVQFVEDANAAYSNGTVKRPTWSLIKNGVNPNLYTLSICREGHNHEIPTDKQYESILSLYKKKVKEYNVSIDREHIIGHFMINSVDRWYCPGEGFSFDKLFNDLLHEEKIDELTWQKRQAIDAVLNLAKKGIINNVEVHINNIINDVPIEPYVVFSLFDRIIKEE